MQRPRAAPVGQAAMDAETAEARRFEETELMAAELARLCMLARPERERDAEARRLHAIVANANASRAIRRAEEDAAHPQRGHVGAEEEDGRLVLENHVHADVQLREPRHGDAAEPAAVVRKRDHRDEVRVPDSARLEAERKDLGNGLSVRGPAREHEIADLKS